MSVRTAPSRQSDASWLCNIGADATAPVVDGLIRVDDFVTTSQTPEVVAVVEKAHRYGAHSVFFEAARNGRAPVAQAFIFLVAGGLDDAAFAQLHKRLWSR